MVVDTAELDTAQLIQVVLGDLVVVEVQVDRNRAVAVSVAKVITVVQVVHQPLTVVEVVEVLAGLVKIQELSLLQQVQEVQEHLVQLPAQQ
jgi:hypothetical protein